MRSGDFGACIHYAALAGVMLLLYQGISETARGNMVLARSIASEIVKALAVLALVLLGFGVGPQPLGSTAFAIDESLSVAQVGGTVQILCGGENGDRHVNGPCHACRASAAVLLPSPTTSTCAFPQVAMVRFAPLRSQAPIEAPLGSGQPRGPPRTL